MFIEQNQQKLPTNLKFLGVPENSENSSLEFGIREGLILNAQLDVNGILNTPATVLFGQPTVDTPHFEKVIGTPLITAHSTAGDQYPRVIS